MFWNWSCFLFRPFNSLHEPGTVTQYCAETHERPRHWMSARKLVAAWGNGDFGRLGHGTLIAQAIPRIVAALLDCDVTHVACGGAHTAAVGADGSVFTWGLNDFGQLGHSHSAHYMQAGLHPVKHRASRRPHPIACITRNEALLPIWMNSALSKAGNRHSGHAFSLSAGTTRSAAARRRDACCGWQWPHPFPDRVFFRLGRWQQQLWPAWTGHA